MARKPVREVFRDVRIVRVFRSLLRKGKKCPLDVELRSASGWQIAYLQVAHVRCDASADYSSVTEHGAYYRFRKVVTVVHDRNKLIISNPEDL